MSNRVVLAAAIALLAHPMQAQDSFAISPRLARAGFYERRSHGIGEFVGPERIENLRWTSMPSTYLRDMRGVKVHCVYGAVGSCVLKLSGCSPTVYVDGGLRTGELDDVLDARQVFAIEVYRRFSLVPNAFGPADCVIAVWTRSFAGFPVRDSSNKP